MPRQVFVGHADFVLVTDTISDGKGGEQYCNSQLMSRQAYAQELRESFDYEVDDAAISRHIESLPKVPGDLVARSL